MVLPNAVWQLMVGISVPVGDVIVAPERAAGAVYCREGDCAAFHL
jgi:hypothetical protein